MRIRGVTFCTDGSKGIPAPGSIGVTRSLHAGSTCELEFDPATGAVYATCEGETMVYVGIPMVLSGAERPASGPSVVKAK